MSQTDIEILQTVFQKQWPGKADGKVKAYVGKFFGLKRKGTAVIAKVEGNHGIYTVSIEVVNERTSSKCSCYIGKNGYCHHVAALAHTFLNDPLSFVAIEQKTLEEAKKLADLHAYLEGITLDVLVQELKSKGIAQKTFAEAIGMSTQHLSAIKSAERRHHYFHELGATKLACLWVLEHFAASKS